ncbi:MFS transporter [Oceanirhabdus sp. W0125-5]|uniref:MFS transporter n=1 Tax=Oceanirhabdus sp. W0125-5 TaxID=2999116 RepID=UPI0022F2EE30|nr:MFS transporter [Oceanirhabdus sp. W0125-5]WBW97513.1 MFS transporter [Oceanirhabdus sp. W0125-5]
MNIENLYRKNIFKNYFYTFFSCLDLTRGLWMIYLATKGVSLVQLGILESIFHITSFFMEIPTGMIADIFGRKTSVLMSRVISFISLIILFIGNDYYVFMISFILSALSYNLESGAGEALIYDSLKEVGEEKGFIRVSSKIELVRNLSSIAAFIIGGILALMNYNMVFYISFFFIIMAFLSAMSMKEVMINKKTQLKNPLRIFAHQITTSVKAVRGNNKIVFFMLFSEIVGCINTTMFFYLQNYWKGKGLNELKIGLIFSIGCLSCSIFSGIIDKIEDRLKERGILLYVPILLFISIGGIAFTKYSYVFYIIMGLCEMVIWVVVGNYINMLIPSENRATILSFRSMIFSFFMIALFPVVGKLGDVIGLANTFRFIFYVMLILVCINTIVVIKIMKKNINRKLTVEQEG